MGSQIKQTNQTSESEVEYSKKSEAVKHGSVDQASENGRYDGFWEQKTML